jgi:3-oxoacyl-[acyl-carrier protein] reductase
VIIVEETWNLSPQAAKDAAAAMQDIEDTVGPIAHEHPGWCGHASFLQAQDDPRHVVITYPWRSVDAHEDLLRIEEPRLAPYYAKYCEGPRSIRYYTELAHK